MEEVPADFGFFRVAGAVPECAVADPLENASRMASLATRAADDGVRLAVFPELALTGYTAGDLFLQKRLEDGTREGLRFLEAHLPRSLVAVIGTPWRNGGKLFNTAAVFSDGKLCGILPKTYLPNYKEFYEKRWFVSGQAAAPPTVTFGGNSIPFGRDLLFSISSKPEVLLGIEICEDLWVPTPPSSLQALAGAQILANLSASDQTIGKADYRRGHLVASQSARCLAGLVFVSCGAGESSSDLVFGGHVLIAENGVVLSEERNFQDGPTLAATDLDVDRLAADRDRTGSFADAGQANPSAFRIVPAAAETRSSVAFTRRIEPHPFVPAEAATRDARCEEVANIQTAGLIRRLKYLPGTRPVLGLSGGLDSALAALITARALAALKRSPAELLAASMPGDGTSERTRENARKLAGCLKAEFREIDIRESVAQHLRDLKHPAGSDLTFENAQARERTQVLMDLSNALNGLVIGTGDLSEIALGWSTYGGDHLSMYDVNASVPKTLVRHVVAYFARHAAAGLGACLKDILETPVSPELLPSKAPSEISQQTEAILGPFELHDFFLYHFLRGGDRPRKLLFLARKAFGTQYSEKVLIKTLRTFLTRFFANQFKRNAMPDGPKVGTVALSPRGDWRMPADVSPAAWLADLPKE
jgi:NAD+ synthase (glutamine-hydrolysing)